MGGVTPASGAIDLNLFVLANLMALVVIYVWAARRASGGWSSGPTIAFFGAIGALALAYLGPFGAWAHDAFWAHMGQHLLVLMIAGPLLVLSSPVRLTYANLGRVGRRRLIRVLRSRPVEIATNPYVGWALFATVLLGSHTQLVMNWALISHDGMEFVMRPLYLLAALIFYYPLIGCDLIAKRPAPSVRLMSLGLMMIPETTLGIVIHFSPIPLYWPYEIAASAYGIDVMTDQKFAGALMWALAMVLDGMWMMVAAIEWWRDQERETTRLERQEAREAQEAATA
ncbi:MAG TPA: cytochrome c oxidase assembly protein [Candidatus Nanopelagicales bacterium]|nr:cytochrome c oxidase assembly protein [Candidatus Nanopelagicales bacterium]